MQVIGGSTETVTLTAPTGAGEIIDAGTQQLRVNTDNDAQEASTTIREPANIAVQIDDTNSPVIEGNRLQVDTIVENTGDGTATDREVALEVNDDEATSRQLTLDGGERAEITLEATVSTVGDQTITVTTGDETAQRTVTVIEAPDEPLFRMSNLSVPDDVFRSEGQSVTVTADVTNIGDVEGSQTVSITIGGTTRSTSDVTLDGNETQTVSTTVPATALLVGDRAVTVSSADDSVSGLIVVREPAPPRFTVDISNIPTPIAGSATSDEVDIAVENTGQGTATQTIELNLTLDDETIDTTAQQVTLDPGGSTTETLSLDVTGESRAGNFTTELTATSANQTTSTRTETDFGTITSGINAADTGGSVQVAAETYRETLSIDKEVAIRSDGAVVTAPEGSSSDATVDISAGAGGTLIDSLTVRGSSTAVQAVETSTITDVQIDNATGQTTTGIDINADDVTVSFSQIQSVREGINVTTADVSVLDTQIADTTFAINATGDASNLTAERLNVLRSENGFFTNTGKHAFTQSNIENNNVAIDADRPGGAVTTVDATENWWGRPSGPLSSEILSPVTVQPFRGNPKIPADYEITSPTGSTSVSDPVTVGETISVDVAVENTGGTSGATNNQRIELFVDGQKEDETAQFQLGENGTVDTASFAQLDTLEYQVEPADAGSSLSLTVRTENNVVSPNNVNAQTPPSIGVESINVGNSVRTDQTLSVDATINNSGQSDGTTDVRLDFNGRPVATETGVSVPGQGTSSVTLTHSPQASLADSDDVSVTVVATDSGATRSDTVDVNAAPEPPEDDDDDAAGGGGGGGGGFGVSGLANPNQLGGVQRQAVSQTVSITDIGQKNDQVRSVGIDFNQQAVGTVSVTALDDPPADTNYPQQRATPLTAVDVTVPDAAENQPATVRIAVDRDLVQDTRAAPGDLQVERFDNGQYTVLQTSVADVTADEVVLEANTPGFSVFAVTVPKPGQQVTPTPTPTPTPTQTPTPAPDETPTTTETETPTSTPGGIPGFGVMVAVLAVLIAALVFHRRSS
ncbi:probable secreted glycoprotein [Haloquadratum walsbyi C23]|uniref:Probable secreted glycoprotein n=1 Tax=Haloquadratum walsbyi (strain DSM 16854 / JCM 12705 / C23) TaxID=768065 RepID=G0LGT7_HALWC|nr:probable secreted glycoprotein [Haloquadratum walsbyi C23]